MADLPDDILRYQRGEMSPLEMHALEKRALQDPFLADALEGAETISTDDFATDLNELKHQIQTHQEIKAVASMSSIGYGKQAVRKVASTNMWVWPIRIAASITLLIATVWIAYKWLPPTTTEKLVLKKESSSPSKPSVASTPLDQTQAPSSSAPVNAEKQEEQKAVSKNDFAKKNKIVDQHNAIESTKTKQESVAILDEKSKSESKVEGEQFAVADKISKDEISEELAKETRKKAAEPVLASPSIMNSKSALSVASIIKGKVISEEDGAPIAGVNVVIQGTSIGTVTDENGSYQLPAEALNQKITFSFIGYQTEIIQANRSNLDIRLTTDVSQLSEVVVTGTARKNNDATEPIVKLAVPMGGIKAYDKYLDTNVRYPSEALAKNIRGKVQVRFTVKADGQLGDFKIIKSLGSGCDEEVVRLVQEGPAWSPTTEDNVPVESEVLVKVKFDPAKVKK